MKGAAAEPYREFPAKATGNNRLTLIQTSPIGTKL